MAIENGIKSSTIKNGFRACGLHPFDSNAIDYSKCIATSATGSLITNETTDVFVTPEAFEESIQKESDTTQHGSVDQSVTISMDRIVEAYDIIGAETIAKIEGDVNKLSREERVIRYFYREFVRPHIGFHALKSTVEVNGLNCLDGLEGNNDNDDDFTSASSSKKMDIVSPLDTYISIDMTDYEKVEAGGSNILCNILPLTSSTEPQTTCTDSELPEMMDYVDARIVNNHDLQEKDIETQCEDGKDASLVISTRRLSEVLNLPATPHRCGRHRNYKKSFQPVLTAKERRDALLKVKEQKEKELQQKKIRALQRQEAKEKRENEKRARMEERKKIKGKSKTSTPKAKLGDKNARMRN
ncbi:uncharacterized protein LOC120906326 [Anopheles arabiensis]|uniref:uncharacterized protein LOC120906326 n=1 Tax=Anopheles arabiensis TaxID=7173 RepID=UPI001AAD2B93|nr:uncharacterized protein LOC120906326 [Anopheles arabiensis]